MNSTPATVKFLEGENVNGQAATPPVDESDLSGPKALSCRLVAGSSTIEHPAYSRRLILVLAHLVFLNQVVQPGTAKPGNPTGFLYIAAGFTQEITNILGFCFGQDSFAEVLENGDFLSINQGG